MRFDNEIFVSYAHIDNEALVEGETGWVSNLHRALEIRLSQLLGKKPSIWRDPKLQGNDFFADELVQRLPKVALLVSIVSPRYVRSDWCVRELQEFWRASAETGGIRVANRARVFKVVKTPVPLDEHPDEIQPLLGYDFYTVESESGRARELSQLSAPEDQRLYWAKLDDLAYDISDLLKSLQSDEGAEAVAEDEVGESEPIYLAETSFDLKEERDAVRREIQSQGFAVLPDQALPLVGPECEELVREQLGRCRLSIHLIGESYGVVPDGSTRSVVELQEEISRERGADSGFARLIWMPPDLESDDERQNRLVEKIRSDAGYQGGMDLLEVPFEDFETELQSWLRPEETPSEDAAEAGDEDDLVRIYLICDQRDLEASIPIEDHLFDQGFEVIPSLFEGDEAQLRQEHEENLKICDAVLLYYGAGNELWLRRKLREIQRSAGLGRSEPLAAKAIYVAPPENPRKKRLRTHEAMVIRPQAGFEPGVLDPFLNTLRGER